MTKMNKYNNIKTFEDIDKALERLEKKENYSKLKLQLIEHRIRYKTTPQTFIKYISFSISKRINSKVRNIISNLLNNNK